MVFASPRRFTRPLTCFCILGLAVAAPLARAAGTEPLPLSEALKIGEKASPRLAAQGARAPLVELVGELQLQLDTVSAAIAAGRQNTADALALRGAGMAAQDRVIEQDRTIERARYALAAWLQDEASRPLANPPDTSVFDHPPTALLANLHEHPEQRIYAEREALARADAALAANSKKSDWSLEVAYGQRGPAFSNMISVMVSIDLPWEAEKRQDRDLAAKKLLSEQAQAQSEEARRMHEAELRGFYADWQTAGVRIERFEKLLLPLARERVAAALAAYRGGRGELGTVLEARRAEAETRLGLVQTQLERARAWAKLNFLLPHEGQP